ncbi:MAG TPA: ergothioneine biosynthesis protein EgtB [Terracidiphilus sp.]
MTTSTSETARSVPQEILSRFNAVRRRTLALCDPLSAEDMMVQSCPEASPVKWHLAHTSWFFESFVLREFLPEYRLFNPDFAWLFNSYYQTFSAFPAKSLRSSFSRPGLDEVLHYRGYIDAGIERLIESEPPPEALRGIELGLNHEEQHQELLLTDVLHAFHTNPLRPAYRPWNESDDLALPNSGDSDLTKLQATESAPLEFERYDGGLREAGFGGDGFCFDNELPRHRVWLEHFSLARRMVDCKEYAAFIEDGGYSKPELWLSAGWDAVQTNGWTAPLYWSRQEGEDGGWRIFTLRGELPLEALASVPVSHVSFYEADAYARWAGKRLPTEFEWESVAEGRQVTGNMLDSGRLLPAPPPVDDPSLYSDGGPAQQFGDCWEWTASAYLAYPGFQPLPGTLGEYNGKFMSNQMVLRGGSCVTPDLHIRASYRNFFAPETRWQFSGIRLAS